VLGHTQRGGTPSPFDRVLATRYGVEAAACVADGQWGRMVRLRAGLIETVTLEEALATHRVDPDGQVVRHAEALGISFGR
jgi:6-phosphofructokinase 1